MRLQDGAPRGTGYAQVPAVPLLRSMQFPDAGEEVLLFGASPSGFGEELLLFGGGDGVGRASWSTSRPGLGGALGFGGTTTPAGGLAGELAMAAGPASCLSSKLS